MKILIVEDEQIAALRLQRLLMEIDTSFDRIEILDSIETVVEWWNSHQPPDLIFLDIHLADGSSFELFTLLDIRIPVIFVTAYDQYAVDAFKVNAIDYLLKPVKRVALKDAIDKFKSRMPAEIDYQKLLRHIRPDNSPGKRFLIKVGQKLQLIEISEAAWFCTENKVTLLVTKEGRRYPVDPSLEKLEEILDPQKFFRINRQFLISLDAIGEMYAYSRSRVKITLNPPASESIIVSTERSPHFKKWLTGEE